jgi:polyhydroxyalkanoate synthesis regulator phasin
MNHEISNWGDQVEGGMLKMMAMRAQNKSTYNSHKQDIEHILDLVSKGKCHLEEVANKRKLDEYWKSHKSEKANLEAEKQALTEQISTLDIEIPNIPEYADMINLGNQIQRLDAEKASLGLFKGKEKKALQERIDSLNSQYSQIRNRVNPAIDTIEQRITSLENRIEAINTELTRPRELNTVN